MTLTVTATTANDPLLTPTSLAHSPTVAVGDLFICQLHLGDSARTISPPSGWSTIINDGGPEAGAQGAIFYITATAGTATPFTFSWTGGGTSYASVMCRYTSNIRNTMVQLAQFATASTTVDNALSYTTASLTGVVNNIFTWGIGSEGSAAITYSSSDTEVSEVGNTNATPERVAMYVTTASVVGATTKTITPSLTNQFHSLTFIGEVSEIPAPTMVQVPAVGMQLSAVHRASRW